MAEGRQRVPLLRQVLESPATTIARNGAWLDDQVAHEGLDSVDLEEALREHGIASVDEVELAVLEPDGSISVVPVASRRAVTRRRRRVRVVNHR